MDLQKIIEELEGLQQEALGEVAAEILSGNSVRQAVARGVGAGLNIAIRVLKGST
jgi:hypothetical protein